MKTTIITEDYVSFEIAKLLKEKGFNVYGDGSFGSSIEIHREYSPNGKTINTLYGASPHKKAYPAPTHQMVLKWLREIHHLHIEISIGSDSSTDADGNTIEKWYYWTYLIRRTTDGHMIYSNDCLLGTEYQSYEDAVEAAIEYCLTKLKNIF